MKRSEWQTTQKTTHFWSPSLKPSRSAGPWSTVEWPGSQTFTNVDNAVVAFALLVVKVVLVSRPTGTDTKDIQKSLGFRLVSVRTISISFGGGRPGEGVLPQEIGSIYQLRGLEARLEWR